jgi:hypothetical protein
VVHYWEDSARVEAEATDEKTPADFVEVLPSLLLRRLSQSGG